MENNSRWGVAIVVLVLGLHGCGAELCGVDPLNPDAIVCDSGLSRGLLSTASIANGLSFSFYASSCPKLGEIVRDRLKVFLKDPGQAAGLLRLMFHECFVEGCEGALLLNATSGEQKSSPNLTLRKKSFEIIDDIKSHLEAVCPKTVSCADIEVLAAAEATLQVGGPSIKVPLGRRDSVNFASDVVVRSTLPSPTDTVSQMLPGFIKRGLDARDLVALSGAHSIGQVHCSTIANRLRPNVDAELDAKLANTLLASCPPNSPNTISLEITSPNRFDNQYFKKVLTGDALLTSDVSLEHDVQTSSLVKLYARNQKLFFSDFANSFVKLSQLGVLSGNQGEVRLLCSQINGHTSF